MNKQDLIAKIVKDTGATKAAAAKMIDSAIDGIGKALKKGDSITFVGFGTFKTSIRKGPHGAQPSHGRGYQDRQAPGPRFTAGKALKDLVK